MRNKVSSTRKVVACLLLLFSAVASASAQTNPAKTATAIISGKITLKNKGVVGIVVFAHDQNAPRATTSTYRGTTDETGGYRITNLPAGTYVINPVAPSLALEDEFPNNTVVLAEGETVEDFNFSMVQGGVITGRITDADGKPLIEVSVTLTWSHSSNWSVSTRRVGGGGIRTDDRGVYRAFGLRPGKYTVAVEHHNYPSAPRASYRQTFYPSVTDSEKATLIEVTAGSETKDIDIMIGRPLATFKASGRIVDAETGKPLPNIKYGLNHNIDESSSQSVVSGIVSNTDGEFKLENIVPGKYSVFIVSGESGYRADWVSFEVVDRDVTDLVLRAVKASSLSGVVVFEGEEKAPNFKHSDLHINAWVESTRAQFDGGSSVPVNADGSFRVTGLRKGPMHFGFASRIGAARNIALVRIERDGIAQPQGITLKDGEQVTGVRLVIKYFTGAIHGQIKVEGDEPVPASRFSVWLTRMGNTGAGYEPDRGNPAPQVDARRRFVAEGLAAGTYEINVSVYDPNRPDTTKIVKQQVTVADNAVSEVTVVVKTKP